MNPQFKEAGGIVRSLQQAGQRAYFAGGAVRDHLLKRSPKDIDIATDADPERILELFPQAKSVGRAFGVLLLKGEYGNYEIASFRTDGPYSDGRHPDWVRLGNAEQDAHRRDFTVNGMFYDPVSGEVIDYVGGREDLHRKRLRCIGDPNQRFSEDFLRLFRMVRFATRLDFEIDSATWQAACDLAPKAFRLAPERVLSELTAILKGPQADRGLHLLTDSGLLQDWLPEVAALEGVEQPSAYHPEGDVLTHTALCLAALDAPSDCLAWGALLHDIGKPKVLAYKNGIPVTPRHAHVGREMVENVARRLRFSNQLKDCVCELVGQHMRFVEFPNMRPATRLRFLAQDRFEDMLLLHRADCMASHGDLSIYQSVEEELGELSRKVQLPPALIDGHDLLKLGYRPGPELGAMLADVRERQLNGELSNRAEALKFVLQQANTCTNPGKKESLKE